MIYIDLDLISEILMVFNFITILSTYFHECFQDIFAELELLLLASETNILQSVLFAKSYQVI